LPWRRRHAAAKEDGMFSGWKGLAALALGAIAGVVLALAGRAEQSEERAERGSLADLAWLAGSWTGDMEGQVAEETWSAPAAGGMMGMFRLLGEKGTSVFEFLLLEEGQGNLHLRFQHVGPGYRVWEKERPLEFRLVSAEEKAFTFESPDPNQSPTRIVYTLPSPTQMIATVETVRDGRVADSFDVVYRRRE
jgi:hypothetical protein